MAGAFRAREERRKVLVRARMRAGPGWSDVCIVDMSSRGLGLRSSAPPSRGGYVEIRRGPSVVIAKVAWVSADRFGVMTQDKVPVAAVLDGGDAAAEPGSAACGARVERRATPRPSAESHARSRQRGQAMEFAFTVAVGCAAALFLAGAIASAVAKPLTGATSALQSAAEARH